MMRLIVRLLRSTRGSISILAAVSLGGVMALAALAVDSGSVFYESRRLQGVADAAALAAAGNISNAAASARAAVSASGWSRAMTQNIVTGTWTPDASLAPAARFVAGGSTPNAASVSVAEDSPLYFGRIFGIRSIHLQRSATAVRIDLAAFTVGSRLASLDGGIANQILGGLTGTNVSLSVSDYNALLGADIDLLAYVQALRTELGLGVATYEQTLATSTTLPHVLNALAATLSGAGNPAGAAAIAKLATVAPNTAMTLSQLADLGQLGKQDHALGNTTIAVNAFSTLETMLQIASGAHQMSLDLSSLAPGLTSVSATLAIGNRMASSPWLALTNKGTTIVRTAQTRLYVNAALPGSAALKLLGINALQLPLYVELGEAQARLSSISCLSTGRQVSLDVQPSLGHASIAQVSTSALSDMSTAPVETPATIVSVPLLATSITGSARIDLSGSGWQSVNFNDTDIANHATKTVSSNGVLTAIASSLMSNLSLNVTVLGLAVPLSPLIGLVKPILTAAAALLDPVAQSLLDLLGIHLGQADVRIDGVRCGSASLVA